MMHELLKRVVSEVSTCQSSSAKGSLEAVNLLDFGVGGVMLPDVLK